MESTPGRRGPYAGTARRREQIITAAFDAFALSGFRGSSLREISEAVGISKAGLLHHFTNKEELLLEVLELREQMNTPPAEVKGLAFFAHMRHTTRVDVATPGAVALFVTTGAEAVNPDHPAHEFFARRYQKVIGEVATAFREAQEAGDLRVDFDPEYASRELIAVLDGTQLQMLLDPSLDRVAAVERYLDSALERYSANSAPVRATGDSTRPSESGPS